MLAVSTASSTKACDGPGMISSCQCSSDERGIFNVLPQNTLATSTVILEVQSEHKGNVASWSFESSIDERPLQEVSHLQRVGPVTEISQIERRSLPAVDSSRSDVSQPCIHQCSLPGVRHAESSSPLLKKRQIEVWSLHFEHAQDVIPLGIVLHAIGPCLFISLVALHLEQTGAFPLPRQAGWEDNAHQG